MRVDYKRDINHNFLIIQGEEETDISSYQVRMLVTNTIEGLLPCTIHSIDGQKLFYYEITSKQSIQSIFQNHKLNKDDLWPLLSGIVNSLKSIREFLLDPIHLMLSPEYIFMDVDKEGVFLCYLPGYTREIISSFRELTEYILPNIDHQDQDAVMLGYGIYRCSMEENFTLDQIEAELFRKKEEIPIDQAVKFGNRVQEDSNYIGNIDCEENSDKMEEGSKKGNRRLEFESFFKEEETRKKNIGAKIIKYIYRIFKKEKSSNDKEQNEWEDMTVMLTKPEGQIYARYLESMHSGEYSDIPLNKEVILIGKDGYGADVGIGIATISRLHSKIRIEGKKVYVIDLHSRNGTFLNGVRMTPEEEYEIKMGDKIEFAEAVFALRE